MSPHNAFYLLQGIETLPLRMARHVANTAAVLDFLAAHAAVAWVVHPDLPEPSRPCAGAAPAAARAPASIFSFGIKGGRAAGRQLHRGAAASLRTWPMSATPRPW